MDKKNFEPEKYGMVICPSCNGKGYIQTPKQQACPKCGGFGYVRKGTEKDENASSGND
jgi:DnaJ-class molecular chaperone